MRRFASQLSACASGTKLALPISMKMIVRATLVCLALVPFAVGCDLQRNPNALAPTALQGGSAAAGGALVGQWASQTGAEVSSLSTCSNFRWNVTSQTATTIEGQFSAVCLSTYNVTGTASGQLVEGGLVRIVLNATAMLPGVGSCPVTLTATGTIEGDALRVPYAAHTCIGDYSGTQTLRRNPVAPPAAPQPPPVPEPTPVPAPTPVPPPEAPRTADEFDLGSATIVLGPKNIASWPQTSTVTSTRAVTGELCISHTKLGQWPNVVFFNDPNTRVEGNQWVFANIGGRWYGGAADWYRPGQACKDVNAQSIGGDAFYQPSQEPMHSWVPRPGEVFGVMSTTPARAWPEMRTLDERSNVVLVRWGG
jgi:hypothetical protein